MSLKRWFKYFTSVRIEINILLAVCLLNVVIIEFIFSNIPELFTGGTKITEIFERLCLSYISSYIFFFLVVHTKNQKDRENLYEYIAQKTYRIIGDAKNIIRTFTNKTNINIKKDEYPSLSDLQEMCKLINPYDQAPLILGQVGSYGTWLQYLNHFRIKTEENIAKIYLKMQFLDSDYLKLVIKIEDCTHFSAIKTLIDIKINNTDLSSFANGLHQYFKCVKDLEEYAEQKFKDYKDIDQK